jgi:hypothetical protein
MRLFKSMLLLFMTLVAGQISFPSINAYAGCCGCTCKPWMCYCMGTGGCPYLQCHIDDSGSLQVQAMDSNEHLSISGSYAASPPPPYESYAIDRLIARSISGQCARTNYTLKLFETPKDRLNFETDFLKYKDGEDNTVEIVARQIP